MTTLLLLTNPYVIVIALNFIKAFDTVGHHTLLDKMAQLYLLDHIYNWLVNFSMGILIRYGYVMSRGGSRKFGKRGAVRGRSPEPSAEGASAGGSLGGLAPKKIKKLDAISCNLAYILGIKMASDIIQNWAFAEQKPVAATISIHTHTHTRIHPHSSKNSSDFGHYKIQIQFQKYLFRHCIQCKKIKLTSPKIGGPSLPGPHLDPPLIPAFKINISKYNSRISYRTGVLRC